jgi:hypothetical protein
MKETDKGQFLTIADQSIKKSAIKGITITPTQGSDLEKYSRTTADFAFDLLANVAKSLLNKIGPPPKKTFDVTIHQYRGAPLQFTVGEATAERIRAEMGL